MGGAGVTLGLLSGYYGGIIDSIIMRLGDAFLAIPRILLSMVILVITSGITTLIFVIGITCWINYARLIRGEVLVIKSWNMSKQRKLSEQITEDQSLDTFCQIHFQHS